MLKVEENIDNASESYRRRVYQNEERILSLLRSLRHENIIKLLGSYTILRNPPEHNLLFPRADDSLKTVLQDTARDGLKVYFPSEIVLLQQLHGLSSAIEKLHDFVSDEYELHLIGCHYDLAPRNILVQRGKLLLADFGLARLRPETSKSMFKAGNGDYLAPECETLYNDNFIKGAVGRASDIWSFGCILLEILIHSMQRKDKAQALVDFRGQRCKKIFGEYVTYLFHWFDKPDPAVTHMLDSLFAQSTSVQIKQLTMIGDILVIDPNRRPLASDITVELFLRAQETTFAIIGELLDDLNSRSTAFELVIERERLLLWGWAARLSDNLVTLPYIEEDSHRQWLRSSRQSFDEINKLLGVVLEELKHLKTTLEGGNHIARPIFLELRQINDMLWALPPHFLVRRITSMLENKLLKADDREVLHRMDGVLRKNVSTRNIARLATIRFLTAKVKTDKDNIERPLCLSDDQVPIPHLSGVHNFGVIPHQDDTERHVIIERIPFDPVEERHLDELYSRCEALAKLLSRTDMPEGFRVLRCSGYFLDVSHEAISIIYDTPHGFPVTLKPVTLKDLISKFHRPCLGKLFTLAHILANCVLQFHKAGWLHKNISSHNVLFFDSDLSQLIVTRDSKSREVAEPPPLSEDGHSSIRSAGQTQNATTSKSSIRSILPRRLLGKMTKKAGRASTSKSEAELSTTSIRQPCGDAGILDSVTHQTEEPLGIGLGVTLREPYLVGFDHSRLNTETAFTSGPSRQTFQKPYQHPSHRGSNRSARFRPEFDFYSFGIVLLELGLWKSIEELTAEDAGGDSSTRPKKDLIQDIVSRLGSAMGALYREATEACLNGSLASSDHAVRPYELFEQFVVYQIAKCNA